MECNERSVPLALDLIDTWAEGSSLTGKAIRVELGTPGQEVLLFPAFTQDDLHVYNRTVQYPERPLLHLNLEGLGEYDWTNSSTFSPAALPSWNGTTSNWDNTLFSVFNDALEVDNKVRLDGFPMFTGIVPEGYFINNLPLSYVSVFMKSLLSTGQILSRVIGYWPGTRSPGNDSSLVLGGYDNGRVAAQDFYTLNPPEECYICSHVTNLTYNGPNGTVDLFDGFEAPLQVVFEMTFPDIKLDTVIQDNLMRATNAQWNSTLGRLVYPSRPEGNITVTLHGNYTTTIINEEFFAPRPVLTENGTIGEDPDLYVALVGNGTLPSQPRLWGRPFLSMNYLIADWSRRQIHLSPVIRERPSVYELGAELVPLCEPQNTTTNATTNPVAASGDSSDNTAAIAGGVVGGIVGVVLIFGLVLFYLRRRKRARAGPEEFVKPELEDTGVSAVMTDSRPKKLDELDSQPFAAEIDSTTPYELPSALPELDFATPQELDSDPRGEITRNEKIHHAAGAEKAAVLPHDMGDDTPRGETSIQSTPISFTERPHTND